MKPPLQGWVIFVALIALSASMYACGQALAHRNTQDGYGAGIRMCINQTAALAAYKLAYTQGDSTAVPVDTNGDGEWNFVWHNEEGFEKWLDSIRVVKLP